MDRAVLNTISPGCTRKLPHEGCSDSAALCVTNSEDGYIVYCFKCGHTEFIPHHDSIAERAERKAVMLAQRKLIDSRSYDLPIDFSYELPTDSLVWLGTAGWTLEMTRRYGIGYSKELQRTILPLSEGFTARSLKEKPKYIEKSPADAYWESTKGNQLVTVLGVTEDILSAGRLGEFIPSMALCGTSISTHQLSLLKNYNKILVWLDPDKAGVSGTAKAVPRLSLFSDVTVVHNQPEPKHMTNNKIVEVLNALRVL